MCLLGAVQSILNLRIKVSRLGCLDGAAVSTTSGFLLLVLALVLPLRVDLDRQPWRRLRDLPVLCDDRRSTASFSMSMVKFSPPPSPSKDAKDWSHKAESRWLRVDWSSPYSQRCARRWCTSFCSVSSQLPPADAARSTTTEPGFMTSTARFSRAGAGRPGSTLS